MNTLQVPSLFLIKIPQRASIPIDLIVVCLWSTLGLVVTAALFTLGFGAEFGQALAIAG
jgi:hypothetical protein